LTVTLPSQARVESAGAGVIVRVPYRCSTGVTSTFSAVLIERTSSTAVTSSGGFEQATCSGLDRTGVLAFHAEAAAWRPGSAFLLLTSDICGNQSCRPGAYAHRTVTLV